MSQFTKRALLSVSDKTGIVEFARGLIERGYALLSTGGTYRALVAADVPVMEVAQYTGFPEMMDGRVKTLHPKIHGGILARRDDPQHLAAMREHGIDPIDIVVCNLYPFEQTVAQDGTTLQEAIEQIDIGGPSMVRSAAKNHQFVAIVTHPEQYSEVLRAIDEGRFDATFRRRLAIAAFELTSRYDAAISAYLKSLDVSGSCEESRGSARQPEAHAIEVPKEVAPESAGDTRDFPSVWTVQWNRRQVLRYGENPHQQAAFYAEPDPPAASLAAAKQLHGKELSYNNLLDCDAAFLLVREFLRPAAAIIKHTNPCGCAVADTLAEAFEKAYAGDPVSAFGSIIGFNRPVDRQTAEQLCAPGRFVEAIIAPGFSEDAFEMLTTVPKWHRNVRLLQCSGWDTNEVGEWDYRRVTGGVLIQQRDACIEPPERWQCVTERHPSEAEIASLDFAWRACKHVKSNAIVLAAGEALVGVGAGQMSRLDAAFIATHKAGPRARGAVAASDAFFPFRDGVDLLADAGVTAIVQPGGSRNDAQVIQACNERGIAMLFTGHGHFRH